MPPITWLPVEEVALIGLFGTIFVAWINYRFNALIKKIDQQEKDKDREIADRYKQIDLLVGERARQLDIYKTIYAEKFKKSQVLMEAATHFYHGIASLRQLDLSQINDLTERKEKLDCLLLELHTASTTTEWILGEKVAECAAKLGSLGSVVIFLKGQDDMVLNQMPADEYTTLFQNLSIAIREELSLNQLESLLPPRNELIKPT